MSHPKISTKRERIGWYFYDWANSAFTTTVIGAFLGPYLTHITKNAADSTGYVHPFGIPIFADSFYEYSISFSVLLQLLLLPVIGAIADYTAKKKYLLGFFAYLGAFTTMGLYFLEGSNYLFGGGLFVIANLSFGASIVMYNAYLNDIADFEKRDAVSSIGWSIGYIGGGVLLACNLVLMLITEKTLGLHAVRICLASAGLWWAVFTIIPMIRLKIRQPLYKVPTNARIIPFGFKKLLMNIKEAKKYPKTLWFLIAFFFFNDGVQVTFYSAAQIGRFELGLDMGVLLQVILMVQFIAFFGTLIFKKAASRWGNKNAILFSLLIWICIIIYAYFYLKTELDFYILGAAVAVVLGGTQALSRSLYSQLIPKGKESEYYSLYELSDKGTSVLGPLIFGLTLQFTESYRFAILSLLFFFIIGFILLYKIDIKKAIKEAGN